MTREVDVKLLTDNIKEKFFRNSQRVIFIINTDIDELQATMAEAYRLTNKKQFKILANPDNREFLELNRLELRKIVAGEK